jgi:hypothetical protein
MQDLLAADTAGLADATAMKVHLFINNIVPSLDSVAADFTPATFTGSTAKSAGTGVQPTYYDAATGIRVIEILEPAGGWHWLCTVTPGAPEVVYGAYLTDNAGTALWGSILLDAPITISRSGQGLDIGFLQFRNRTNSPY